MLQTSNGSFPINIAHRGARALAPENTLAAARKALEVGADMWEIDVNMTADGELIIIHDDTLTRTSDVRQRFPERSPWLVKDFSLAEIRRLDFGSWFSATDPFGQIAAGAVSPDESQSFTGARAPTLREALQFTLEQDWRVNVEIKNLNGTPGHDRVVEKTVALIEELQMVPRVLVSSFNPDYLRRVKAANPAIAVGFLEESVLDDPVCLLKELQAEAYHPKLELVPLADVASLRKQGFAVNVWVANDEASMRALIEAQVTGIFTDFPQLLARLRRDRATQG